MRIRDWSADVCSSDLHGHLDLVVARNPAPPESPILSSTAIARDPLVIVVSRQHPLASRISPAWKDLKGNPWVVPTTTSPVYHALIELLHKHDLELPSGSVESVSLIANIGLISKTSLIGLLPLTLAIQHVSNGTHFIVPLDTSSLLGRLHAVWRKIGREHV